MLIFCGCSGLNDQLVGPRYGEGLRHLSTFLMCEIKIIFIRDVAICGRHNTVGDTVGVSYAYALALINMGKAQPKDKPKSGKDRSLDLTTSHAPALVKRIRSKD